MKKALVLIVLTLTLLFLYGKYIEVKNFKVREYTITNEKIPSSFTDLKIIQFGDLLYEGKRSQKFLDKITSTVKKNEPDLIILTGDLLKKEVKYSKDDLQNIKDKLKEMEASLYKIAVIGDNDNSHLAEYKDILYEAGFTLLDNQNMLLFYKDTTPINIIGITNYEKIEDFNTLLTTDIAYNYSLAITHKPDTYDNLSNYHIDTTLSGHSLGGIVNIPFYGGIFTKSGAKKYINDYYKNGDTELYITNGLGFEDFEFRLFNTPSINIFRFSK